ncbi:DUF4124 domain-containing protein [Microbulbifer sp. TYP-18]|uniref:DUF4124 domain-containing protein n=1 Tax=Microbulbifer sp. TYP-18 TaxID=3230024 RepID=UPI0034C6A2E1
MKRRYRVGLMAVLIWAGTAAADQLYRWVDSEGRVHFSDRPPKNADADNIAGQLRSINSIDATDTRGTSPSRRQAQLQQEYATRQQTQRQQERHRRANACRKARERLRILQGRVAFIDEKGREVVITERERQQQAQRLQGEIARVCS